MIIDLFLELLELRILLRHFGWTTIGECRHPVVSRSGQCNILAHHSAQLSHLVLEPSNDFLILGNLIFYILCVLLNICLDVLGSVGVLQGIVSLFEA